MPYKNKEDRKKRYKERIENDPTFLCLLRQAQLRKRVKKLEWFRTQKEKPCRVCKNNFHPACMDFHHIDPSTKEFDVSCLKYSKERIMKEMDKCILVCANCHRLIENNLAIIPKYDISSSA